MQIIVQSTSRNSFFKLQNKKLDRNEEKNYHILFRDIVIHSNFRFYQFKTSRNVIQRHLRLFFFSSENHFNNIIFFYNYPSCTLLWPSRGKCKLFLSNFLLKKKDKKLMQLVLVYILEDKKKI